jgi:para-nitrobenzyl esterase
MTDHVFRQPAIRLAETQVAHTADVALYRFDLGSTGFDGTLGACHAIEVPFVFDNLDRGGVDVLLGGLDDGARALAARLACAWTTTARIGRPAHDELPWPAYDLDTRANCVLDRRCDVVADLEGEIRRMWAELRAAGPLPAP